MANESGIVGLLMVVYNMIFGRIVATIKRLYYLYEVHTGLAIHEPFEVYFVNSVVVSLLLISGFITYNYVPGMLYTVSHLVSYYLLGNHGDATATSLHSDVHT